MKSKNIFTTDSDGNVFCNNKKLTSLKGAPINVDGTFDCSNNKLTSLEGAPFLVRDLICNNNKLKTLNGAPITIDVGYTEDAPIEWKKLCGYDEFAKPRSASCSRLCKLFAFIKQLFVKNGCKKSGELEPLVTGRYEFNNNPNLSQEQIEEYINFIHHPDMEHIDPDTWHFRSLLNK